MDRRSMLKLTGGTLTGMALSPLFNSAAAKTPATGTTTPGVLPKPTAQNPLLLNFNENSIGMAPKAREAVVQSLGKAFRYPDDPRAELITLIGKRFGLTDKHVSLGNGSSENIQAIIHAWANQARQKGQPVQLVVPDPTFNYAELYAKSINVPVVKVPLRADMHFDLPALQAASANFNGISIYYLCNPNNPTATLTPSKDLLAWVRQAPANVLFLMDEAYAEFVTDPAFDSAVNWVKAGQSNLAVVRTFSKLYALAGLRVGYAIAVPALIEQFEAFMSLDNTNLAGAVAAIASLQDPAFQKRSIESVNQSRAIVTRALDELGLKYAPSHGNFILHQIKGEVKTYQERMKAQHIVVGREFPPLKGYSRLTLGTPEEMTVFVAALKAFRNKGWV